MSESIPGAAPPAPESARAAGEATGARRDLAARTKSAKPLPIVLYPHPVLKKRAREVTREELLAGKAGEVDLRELVERMLATMYEADGIGLAAPQVGIGLRLWVADPSKERNAAVLVINPVLSELHGTQEEEEGCLSLPEIRAHVKRYQRLVVSGLDSRGEPLSIPAADLLARIVQHETDHLDGILFIQKIGTAARFMLRSRIKALENEYEALARLRKKP